MRSQNFKPLGVVVADECSRIAFGKAGVRHDDKYTVAVSDDDEILLTPLSSVPKRELVVWESDIVRASLARALAQSAGSETVDLGNFSQFADGGGEAKRKWASH